MNNVYLEKTFKYSSSQAFKCSFLELLEINVLKWRQMNVSKPETGNIK